MNYKSTFTWKFQTGLKLRLFFNCRKVLKIFVYLHEHFIFGVWTLVNLNWPIKFFQTFISFRVENSLQVIMCSHTISRWFENFTSVNLTEVKYYPKWTQTQSEIKFMWTQIENTPRTEVNSFWFDFTLDLMWTYSNMKVWCRLWCQNIFSFASTLAINIIPLCNKIIFLDSIQMWWYLQQVWL